MTARAPASDPRSAETELLAVESARRAAVDAARRPAWLINVFAATLGVAFASVLSETAWGWPVGASVFVVGLVAFFLLDLRLRRRRGRLMNFSGGSAVRYLATVAVIFGVGRINPPEVWQPWFAIAAGTAVALVVRLYILWDEAESARRLATGDFDPHDLMP